MVKVSENFRIYKHPPKHGDSHHHHPPSPGLGITHTVLQPSKSINLPSVNKLKGTTNVYREGEPIDFDDIVTDSVDMSPSPAQALSLPALTKIVEEDTPPLQSDQEPIVLEASDQHIPETVARSETQSPRELNDIVADVDSDIDDFTGNNKHAWSSGLKSRFSRLVLDNANLRVSETNELNLIARKNIKDQLIKEYPNIDPKRFDVQLLAKRLKTLVSFLNSSFLPVFNLSGCSYDPKTHHLNYNFRENIRKSKSKDGLRKQIIENVKHDLGKKNIYNIDPRVFIKFFTTNCDYLIDIEPFVIPAYITGSEYKRQEEYNKVREEQEESLAELRKQGESLKEIQTRYLIESINDSIDAANIAMIYLRNRQVISEEQNDVLVNLTTWENMKKNSAVLIKLAAIGKYVTSLGCEESDDGVSKKDLHHLEVLTTDLLGFINRRGYFNSES